MHSRALILVISCIILACTPNDGEETMTDGAQTQDVMGGDRFLLSQQQLDDLQLTASQDDGESAFKIYRHLMVGGSRDGLKEADANFWLNMSADMGFLTAIQHRVGKNLDTGSRQSCWDAISEFEGLDDAGRRYLSNRISDSALNRCRTLLTGEGE